MPTRSEPLNPVPVAAALRSAPVCPALPWWVTVPLAALALAAAAQVRIPLPGSPVPMTLQLLAVLLTGFALAPARAVGAVLLYLVCGAAGAPVFAGTGLIGPTGGYLFGFAVAAWLVSRLGRGWGRSPLGAMAAASLGAAVVLLCGSLCLTVWHAGDWRLALMTGLVPFAPKAAIESALAAVAVSTGRRVLRSTQR